VKIIYLHGFASGPGSRKARFFRDRLEEAGDGNGIEVEIPDLSEGDFENLTVTSQLRVIEKLASGKQVVLVGSSLGGYLAALYAARHPAEVRRLVLLAPAFGFAARWPSIVGPEGMERWKSTGKIPIYHYGEMRYRDLGVAMIHDAEKWEADPKFAQAALIFHGVKDEVVPVEGSRRFVEKNPKARLIELETDHELLNVLPEIWEISREFLLG
jgi:pimeloyl-ACP methyl ester carboxylesterase